MQLCVPFVSVTVNESLMCAACVSIGKASVCSVVTRLEYYKGVPTRTSAMRALHTAVVDGMCAGAGRGASTTTSAARRGAGEPTASPVAVLSTGLSKCADSFSMQWTTYPIRYFLITKKSGP